MSGRMYRACSHEYAGPAFYKSPPASSLPIPQFSKHSRTVPGVRNQPAKRAQALILNAITHIKQASSGSEKSSPSSSSERKWLSLSSDTKSHDGKKAMSATTDEDNPIDVVRNYAFKCSITLCLTHLDQKPKTTIQRSPAFEKLAKRMEEDKQAQAKRETTRHQTSEILEPRQGQQAIIDRAEQRSTNVTLKYTPQELIAIRDQRPTIPANVQRQAQGMQQMWMIEEIQEMWQRSNQLLQLATERLGQNLARQVEILQQRLDEVNEKISDEERNLADDEMGLTSSSDDASLAITDDEVTLVNTEIDREESHHGEVILPSNLSLVANSLETVFEESGETAVEVGSGADQGTPETEEEAEDSMEDEGYYSMEEMVEEQEDEGYYSMEE